MTIVSLADLRTWAAADIDRMASGPSRKARLVALVRHPQLRYLLCLRITELVCNTRTGRSWVGVRAVLKWNLQRSGIALGYTIPINTIGAGIRLPHWGTIVVSGSARVGRNCQILQNVTIGSNNTGSPTVGDDVFVGPGATIIGAVTIGNNAVLTANSATTKDVPANETWGGVPSRRLDAKVST